MCALTTPPQRTGIQTGKCAGELERGRHRPIATSSIAASACSSATLAAAADAAVAVAITPAATAAVAAARVTSWLAYDVPLVLASPR